MSVEENKSVSKNFDEARRKAVTAFHSMREKAAQNGYMSDGEIEKEIEAVRKENKGV